MLSKQELVKHAYQKLNYSEKEILTLSQCIDPVSGPSFFIENFVYVKTVKKGRVKLELFDFQRDLLRNYHEYRYSIAMIGRQMGKALSLQTPILTPSGFSTMGDLSVGDIIYGSDGNPTTITYITDTMHDRPCYRLEFTHGDEIIADAEHLWVVYHPHKKKEVLITTEQLLHEFEKLKDHPSSNGSMHIKCIDTIQFESKDVPMDPYHLGLWLGAGGATDTRITCTHEDYQEYQKIFKERGVEILDFYVNKDSDAAGMFSVKGGAKLHKQLGVWGNKHIPIEYLHNSEEVRLSLLQGLMDSDGWAEKNGVCRFSRSDEEFITQVRYLLSTLGIKSTVKGFDTTHKDHYVLSFSEQEKIVFGLPRKAERQQKLKGHEKNKRFYFRSVEKIESVPVRCLQVDNKDSMFLCGETLIPTHNTTLAAAYLLWYAIFNPDSTILIASNIHDGAKEIMDMIRYAYEDLPDFIRPGTTAYNVKSIYFDNGSRILAQATTPNTGRGKAISLVYLDEFAFVEPRIAKEFWTSLSPTLSTGGKCIITSTPNTDEDQFAEIWFGACDTLRPDGTENEVGRNFFKSYKAGWSLRPDRDEVWAEQELAKIGEERFRREHEVEFIAFEETLINSIKLADIKGIEPLHMTGDVRWYEPIDPKSTYVIGLDPSMGTGGNYSAIQVIAMPAMKQVAEWHNNKLIPEMQLRVLRDISSLLHEHGVTEIYWSVENNSLGEACLVDIRSLGEESFHGIMVHDTDKAPGKKMRKGFNTTNRNKVEACARLKTWIETGKLTVNSKHFISELKTFIAQGPTFRAKTGCNDDLVMAMVLVIRMLEAVSRWDDQTYNAISTTTRSGNSDFGNDDGELAPMPVGFL